MTINIKCFRQVLAFCAILFFPFNNSISGRILFGALNPYIFLLIGLILLIPDLKRKISKRTLFVFFAEIVIVFLALMNLRAPGELWYILIQLAYLLFVPILMNVNIDKKAVVIAISIFTIEHVLGTLFPVILPGVYESSFLSFICKSSTSYCPARIAFKSGMNAGITIQSSTNGCYMAIFALFHACRFLDNPKKKNSILAIITMVCLLIIGKRAHFLFTIIAIFIAYITRNKNFNIVSFVKNNLKIIVIGVISLLGIIAVSNAVPQIRTTIDRIAASKDSDDITSRRGPLYDLAIVKWKERPIFGNGWGAYVMASHDKFGIDTYGSDYMHAHDDYLEILCDKGLVGLCLYAALLVWIIKGAYRIRNNGSFQKFSFVYIIFFVLYGFTGTPLYIISNFVFLLATIIIREREDEKNRRNNI